MPDRRSIGSRVPMFIVAGAILAGACTADPPRVRPPASDSPTPVALRTGDVMPTYVAPDPRAVAAAIVQMEAHADSTRRDRYLNDVKEKTGCTVRVLVARLPAGKNLEARATAAETTQKAKLQADPKVDRVAATHAPPAVALKVTTADGRSEAVGVISVVVATEFCPAPSPSATPSG